MIKEPQVRDQNDPARDVEITMIKALQATSDQNDHDDLDHADLLILHDFAD